MSRADFAARCGVDEAMVVAVETRKTRPSTAYVAAVAAWVGRPVRDVFVFDPEPLRIAEELLTRHEARPAPPSVEPPLEVDPELVAALDRCIGDAAVTLLAPPHPRGRHLVLLPGRAPETASTLDAALRIVGPRPQPWEDLLRGLLASLFPPASTTGCWRATVQAVPFTSTRCELALATPPKKFCGRGETAGLALAGGIAAMSL